ncbi:hypothetical protein COV15_00770 [Candidatus Woesearchaeota archaeon CG10_big_fil_rev_8_21_14_0_10_34_12]|nr:MAG: hypothetical protein COV15_00770 [Candidatus Woesearchaeota archaeon CG10_big_fil_rev_8_21_14_0_10_34_12]
MTKKNKKNFFNENYKFAFNYLKESKIYIYSIIFIFIASFAVGLFYPAFLREFILNLFNELSGELAGASWIQASVFILYNNLKNSFVGMISGAFFGIIPLMSSFLNGYIFGFVINASTLSFKEVLLRTIPHGIFEIPALIISLSVGMRFGFEIFQKKFWYNLENLLRVFLFVVLPLLIIAAIIESSLFVMISG